MLTQDKCSKCANKLSWIGLWDSFLLTIFKGVIGLVTRSHALVASAIYSFHDVISSLAIIIGVKVATAPKDEEHPYGHGKVEYIISLLTSLIIMGGTIFLLVDAVRVILSGEHSPPHWAALGAALISLVANETIYRYNICAYRHLNSPAMLTHAKHHRADAISSGAVFVAILGAQMGYSFLDPLVAVFEAGHLIILSMEILYHGSTGLMDRSVDQGIISSIRQLAGQIQGVEEVRMVKTRQVGRAVWVDLYVRLPISQTMAEAQLVAERIQQTIHKRIKYLGNVNIIYT